METYEAKNCTLLYNTVTLLISLFVLYLDVNMSMLFNVDFLYVLPLLMSFKYQNVFSSFYLAVFLSVTLISVDVFLILNLQPRHGNLILDGFITLIMLWTISFYIFKWKQLRINLGDSKKKLEQLVLENKQQLEALNESAIVSITDCKGIIIQVNDLFCSLSKYTKEELLGKCHSIVNSGIHPHEFFQNLWRTISKGDVWKGEICNKDKHGEYYWVHSTIVPFYDIDGCIEKYISVRFDITQQKKQLEQLQCKALELNIANEELEAFSYSVSHDLRAPLRSIEGFAVALKDNYQHKLDKDAVRWIDFIVNNANKMDTLIREILEYSKLGRCDFKKRKINMKVLVYECFENMKNLYSDKEISFHVCELPELYGDISMMRQVWHNLISNALKYSSKKDRIIITIKGVQKSKESVYIIKDNGVGFDEKYTNLMYGVFQRLHKPEEFEGNGVGLAIVHRILQKHGGTITAKSSLGKGAEFTFTINNNL